MHMKALPVTQQTFFKRAIGVAEHYGFCHVDDARVSDVAGTPSLSSCYQHTAHDAPFDRAALLGALDRYAQGTELKKRQPLMFYTPSLVSHPSTPGVHLSAMTLSAIGSSDPLAEVMVLKGVMSILQEIGIKRHQVQVNSIGDGDSFARFIRDAGNRLKQRSGELPDAVAKLLSKNPSQALTLLLEARHPVVAELPSTLDYLTAPSRKYFKELLELLERAEVPFVLNDRLHADHLLYAHSLYEIRACTDETCDAEGSEIIARGGRFDTLTKAYARTAIPATGIVLLCATKQPDSTIDRPRRKQPNACLIHIGREARIKSIAIVDAFLKKRIPIEQCLQYERFSEQLAYAESRQSRYVIILGQREVHEGVVIVRNASNRSQHTVPIATLPEYLAAAA